MDIRHSAKRNIGTKLLLVLMPAWLALTPHSVLAHDGATGASTTANTNITSTTWRTFLRSGVINQFGNVHYCTVVGSADARFVQDDAIGPDPTILDNCRYEFGLSLNGANPSESFRRTVELNDNPDHDDQNFIAVGSTAFLRIPAGNHTFHWRARKTFGSPAICAAQVVDASMTVNCFDTNHGLVIVPPPESNNIESAN